jgi:hypothetical protein
MGDLAARMAEGSLVAPAVYIGYSGETAEPLLILGGATVTASMAVIYVVQHYAGGEMSGAYGLHEAKRQARERLHYWRPDGAIHPVEFLSGQIESTVESNIIIWQDIFTMQYALRVEE